MYTDEKQIEKILNKYLRSLETWLNKWRLQMAAHKCNYLIINNCRENPANLNLKIYKSPIQRNKSSTFLGLVIDEKLNFQEHFQMIKKKCVDRLNIIKITAHKSWNLSQTTLITMYKSLVGSIFEYPAILLPHLSANILNSLQIIQNNALRTILKKPRETPIISLHELGSIKLVKNRLEQLARNYLINAIVNNNPLILDSFDEYIRFSGGRITTTSTLFDNHKSEISKTINSNQQKISQAKDLEFSQFNKNIQATAS